MSLEALSDEDLVRESELCQARIDYAKRTLRSLSEDLAEAVEKERLIAAEMGRRDGLQPVFSIKDLPVGSVCEVDFRGESWVVEILGFSCGGAMVDIRGSSPEDETSRGLARCEEIKLLDVYPQEVVS